MPEGFPVPGDHEAFASFYRQYEGPVTAYMRYRVSNAEIAADLTMEVFAAALLSLSRDGAETPRNPVAWLFGIAHHKLVDYRRRQALEDRARRELGMERIAITDADIERIDSLTNEHVVIELLDRLPRDQRDAIRARILEDRDYDDIASDLEASEAVVRQRVSRGLRALNDDVGGC